LDYIQCDTIQMSEQTEELTIKNLRNFHNWIKLELILEAKKQTSAVNLLDVAVGRGGDIMKWSKAKIKYVTGFDFDSKSIYEKVKFDGAIKRYNNMKNYNIPRCFFWNVSATDPRVLEFLNTKDNNRVYDIVSCQFSFHYFVKDIDIVLNMISNKLRSGGLFIGTAADGHQINLSIQNENAVSPILTIKKDPNDESMYFFEMNSEKTSRETYFEIRGASHEYFLYQKFLIEKCEIYNLKLVNTINFRDWYSIYNGDKLTPDEQMCSFLNFSFVFQKI